MANGRGYPIRSEADRHLTKLLEAVQTKRKVNLSREVTSADLADLRRTAGLFRKVVPLLRAELDKLRVKLLGVEAETAAVLHVQTNPFLEPETGAPKRKKKAVTLALNQQTNPFLTATRLEVETNPLAPPAVQLSEAGATLPYQKLLEAAASPDRKLFEAGKTWLDQKLPGTGAKFADRKLLEAGAILPDRKLFEADAKLSYQKLLKTDASSPYQKLLEDATSPDRALLEAGVMAQDWKLPETGKTWQDRKLPGIGAPFSDRKLLKAGAALPDKKLLEADAKLSYQKLIEADAKSPDRKLPENEAKFSDRMLLKAGATLPDRKLSGTEATFSDRKLPEAGATLSERKLLEAGVQLSDGQTLVLKTVPVAVKIAPEADPQYSRDSTESAANQAEASTRKKNVITFSVNQPHPMVVQITPEANALQSRAPAKVDQQDAVTSLIAGKTDPTMLRASNKFGRMQRRSRSRSRSRTAQSVQAKPDTTTANQLIEKQVPLPLPPCYYCRGKHALIRCSFFSSLHLSERLAFVQKMKLCINCFSQQHSASSCRDQPRCRRCSEWHHTLLHRIV